MPTRRRGLYGWTLSGPDIRLTKEGKKLWGTHLSWGSKRKRYFAQHELKLCCTQLLGWNAGER